MMTPLEIQNQTFKSRFKGFDREEVRHFLYLLAEEVQNLLEALRLHEQELHVLRSRLKDMEDRDRILKDTLISAQQIKKEIQENATKEAMLVIREGELHAETLFENARKEVEKIALQLMELKRQRNDCLAEIEMMVTRFTHFIEVERQQALENDKLHRLLLEKRESRSAAGNREGLRGNG